MKRRTFIKTMAATVAGGFLPNLPGENLLFGKDETPSFTPYDNNMVVRVYDPTVGSYRFQPDDVYWKMIDRDVLRSMLVKGLKTQTGEQTGPKAWRKILAGSANADVKGKKVAVKVNFNNTIRDITKAINVSPEMMIVVTQTLVDAGINEGDITIFDCSRPFPDAFKSYIRTAPLNDVALLGNKDNLPASTKFAHLTDNAGMVNNGKQIEFFPLPQVLIDSDYFINVHLLKMHMPGVTGAMKNLFGLSHDVASYVHFGGSKPFPNASHLSDISLSEEVKKRARLNISELVYAGHSPDTLDKYTNEDFFPGGMPSSLVVSPSPFYHDCVLYNFVRAEYLTCPPPRPDIKTLGPDTWLRNAAASYPAWKYGLAEYVASRTPGLPPKDLSFEHINYISVLNDRPKQS
jgi:hypothetical protein